jgi:hypothetical protein
MVNLHGPGAKLLPISPATYDPGKRMQAATMAAYVGLGVAMHVHSSHTEFWTDKRVPPWKIDVYSARTYKGPLEFDRRLEHPTEPWSPFAPPVRTAEDRIEQAIAVLSELAETDPVALQAIDILEGRLTNPEQESRL